MLQLRQHKIDIDLRLAIACRKTPFTTVNSSFRDIWPNEVYPPFVVPSGFVLGHQSRKTVFCERRAKKAGLVFFWWLIPGELSPSAFPYFRLAKHRSQCHLGNVLFHSFNQSGFRPQKDFTGLRTEIPSMWPPYTVGLHVVEEQHTDRYTHTYTHTHTKITHTLINPHKSGPPAWSVHTQVMRFQLEVCLSHLSTFCQAEWLFLSVALVHTIVSTANPNHFYLWRLIYPLVPLHSPLPNRSIRLAHPMTR